MGRRRRICRSDEEEIKFGEFAWFSELTEFKIEKLAEPGKLGQLAKLYVSCFDDSAEH